MTTVAISMHVKATAEQVWEYLRSSRNIVEWWPNCAALEDVPPLSEGGFAFKWTGERGEAVLRSEVEEVLAEPGEGISVHLAGDICGTIRWRVRREDGGTRVVLQTDYAVRLRPLLMHLSPLRLLRFEQDEAAAIASRVVEQFSGKPAGTEQTRLVNGVPGPSQALLWQ